MKLLREFVDVITVVVRVRAGRRADYAGIMPGVKTLQGRFITNFGEEMMNY